MKKIPVHPVRGLFAFTDLMMESSRQHLSPAFKEVFKGIKDLIDDQIAKANDKAMKVTVRQHPFSYVEVSPSLTTRRA